MKDKTDSSLVTESNWFRFFWASTEEQYVEFSCQLVLPRKALSILPIHSI